MQMVAMNSFSSQIFIKALQLLEGRDTVGALMGLIVLQNLKALLLLFFAAKK